MKRDKVILHNEVVPNISYEHIVVLRPIADLLSATNAGIGLTNVYTIMNLWLTLRLFVLPEMLEIDKYL